MKNIILAIAFCFSSICAFAQKQFDGAWISDESNYITTIVSGEYGVYSVTNFNPWTGDTIKEKIISCKKRKFIIQFITNILCSRKLYYLLNEAC